MIKIGDLVDQRYKILSYIGHGGMSEVYQARDIILKRFVALKIMLPENFENIENIIRLQNEARILASLNNKYIIKIFDYGELDSIPFIVYEYIKYQNLKQIMANSKKFSLNEACSIMLQLCDAVAYIHSKNIIHRDLKPENIFYLPDGTIKLSDFGISYIVNGHFNIYENNKIMGTPQYVAPELVSGKKPSFQSDIYSLGIMFYQFLTGTFPYNEDLTKGITKTILNAQYTSVLTYTINVDPRIDKIISKACNVNYHLRYQNVNQFKEEILYIYNKKNDDRKIKHNVILRIFGILKD